MEQIVYGSLQETQATYRIDHPPPPPSNFEKAHPSKYIPFLNSPAPLFSGSGSYPNPLKYKSLNIKTNQIEKNFLQTIFSK